MERAGLAHSRKVSRQVIYAIDGVSRISRISRIEEKELAAFSVSLPVERVATISPISVSMTRTKTIERSLLTALE
jgi:hypothetical protein